MTAIAIVEPHRMTRLGVEHAATTGSVVRVVGSVASLAELELDAWQPQVVVLSETACGDSPADAVESLRGRAHVLMMVDVLAPSDLLAILQAGAQGFVTLDVQDAELVAAITAVTNGAFYLMAGLADKLHGKIDRRRDEQVPERDQELPDDHAGRLLGPREVQTLRLVASGYTHGQIARRMGLTEMTINTYVKRIRAKLNAGNKAELTRKAIDLGYLPTERHSRPTGAGIRDFTSALARTA